MEVKLFGAVELKVNGTPVDLGMPRQRLVFAAIAADVGHSVSLGTLIDRVWGIEPPNGVRQTLYVYISRLRAVVGPKLRRGSTGYRLDVDPARSDVYRVESLVRQAEQASLADRAAHLSQALELMRGVPLADLDGPWPDLFRSTWRQTRIGTAIAWAEAEAALNRPERTIGVLSALLSENPLVETLAAALMGALNGSDRRAEAIALYGKVRHRLAEELGVEPGTQLRQLHLSLLQNETTTGDGAKPPTPPARTLRPGNATTRCLPPDVGDFVGRAAELQWLDSKLEAGMPVLVIAGTAGVGKTATAVRWAHLNSWRFPDGQLHLNLRGYDNLPRISPSDALGHLLRRLGVPASQIPPDIEDASALYRSLLDGKKTLVLLDNASDVEQVRPLIPGRGNMLVVTSRSPLAGLIAKDGARCLRLGLLTFGEAHDLLRAIVGEERVNKDPAATAELISGCAGLPLALRIAAAQLATTQGQSVAEYSARLSEVGGLRQLRLDGDPASSLSVVFGHSYACLDSELQRTFRMLGALPLADFTPEVVGHLLGADQAGAQTALRRLVDACLIEDAADGRCTFHDLLRAYAGEHYRSERHQRSTADDGVVAATRYYVASVWRALALLRPGDPRGERADPHWTGGGAEFSDAADAMSWLETERLNLVALVAAAETGDPVPARAGTQLAQALFGYFYVTSHWADWETVNGCAVRIGAASGDALAEAVAHNDLGLAQWKQGRLGQAIVSYKQAEELFRQAADFRGLAACLGNAGIIHWQLGDYQAALACQQESLAHNQSTANRHGQAVVWTNIGTIYERQGRLDEARSAHAMSMEIYTDLGDLHGQALACSNLGIVGVKDGSSEQAIQHLRQALDFARGTNYQRIEAEALTYLGAAQRQLGNHPESLRNLYEAAALAAALHEETHEAEARRELGSTLLAMGRRDEAEAQWTQACALFSAANSPETEGVQQLLRNAGR